MVIFNEPNYKSPMDKKSLEDIDISPRDIGISQGIGDPWSNIKTAITAGASHIELGFMGKGRGSINSPTAVTPEIIGKDKREDIRQLAKINKIKLSTHASANTIGFTGLEQNKFSKAAAEKSIHEVKKAIDFAADTAEGGVVVIHSGEYPRSIAEWSEEKFESYKGEAEHTMVGIVNKKSGEILANFTKDIELEVPKKDEKGNFLLDDQGNILTENQGYKYFIEEAKKRKQSGEKEVTPEILFFEAYLNKEKLKNMSEEQRYLQGHKEIKEQESIIIKNIEGIKKMAKKDKEFAEFKAIKTAEEMGITPNKANREKYKEYLEKPIEFLEKNLLEKIQTNVKHHEQAIEAAARSRTEIEKKLKEMTTITQYAKEESTANIAKIAMYGYEVEKKRKLKKPLVISPENVFTEMYGGHPDELREIIQKSRDEFTKLLMMKKKISASDAKKIAHERIKATFDIGHANLWRKYYQGSDEDFKKWLINKVKKLNKEGIIGHVHVADNFGYDDEHLAPGQGNVPLKEFIEELKKSGLSKEIIVEPGGQGEGETIYTSLTEAWRKIANTPIYGAGGSIPSKSWTDFSGAYMGRTHSPQYMAGHYLINPRGEENWWSGVGLE